MTARARRLRSDTTGPERALWKLLRSRQLAGLKFRHQHPIGPYILDFYCVSASLAIELDGLSHDATTEADSVRTAHLQQLGVRVLRILNDDVINDPDAVLEKIAEEARNGASAPSPSPSGRGPG